MGKKTKIIVKDYLIITLGLLINSLGWTACLIPAEIVGGGVSGIASLIFYASGLPVAVSFFAINSILIFGGIKILGKGFGIKTIYSVIVIAKKHESPNIIRIIKEEDPIGFISMGTVMGVYGGGFEELRA